MALIIALLAIFLLAALGTALTLTMQTELLVVSNFRSSFEARYAAEALLERVLPDLLTIADWNTVIAGTRRSTFADGQSVGARVLPDGSTINLMEATNVANCRKAAACSVADMDAVTDRRPWGTNNPRWTLFGHGPLTELLPNGGVSSPYYAISWVADDFLENDDDPTTDGVAETNPGRGIIGVRSEAFGPGGARHAVEASVGRADSVEGGPSRMRLLSWRDVR